ncbi:hypothetical protein EVAR_53684_1 [Eumeta japonica]|uniref:Uncharacterized protein n=1 Tax=Eumeta variegata TaxID=151549 RepID=A0A4C1YQY7_EUMVA|nr:hypothetical protein EVAR_53684_1 [Eumeta japonica]
MAAAGDMSPERVKQMFSWTQVGWVGPRTDGQTDKTDGRTGRNYNAILARNPRKGQLLNILNQRASMKRIMDVKQEKYGKIVHIEICKRCLPFWKISLWTAFLEIKHDTFVQLSDESNDNEKPVSEPIILKLPVHPHTCYDKISKSGYFNRPHNFLGDARTSYERPMTQERLSPAPETALPGSDNLHIFHPTSNFESYWYRKIN